MIALRLISRQCNIFRIVDHWDDELIKKRNWLIINIKLEAFWTRLIFFLDGITGIHRDGFESRSSSGRRPAVAETEVTGEAESDEPKGSDKESARFID